MIIAAIPSRIVPIGKDGEAAASGTVWIIVRTPPAERWVNGHRHEQAMADPSEGDLVGVTIMEAMLRAPRPLPNRRAGR